MCIREEESITYVLLKNHYASIVICYKPKRGGACIQVLCLLSSFNLHIPPYVTPIVNKIEELDL
jgi:hypothetical protein